MNVLAKVVLNGPMQNEPAATLALAHILNASPDMAKVFVGMLRQTNIEFEPGLIHAELSHGDCRPDLTICDHDGKVRFFVENKFWASLTDAQPVSYLKGLPEDPRAGIFFIVPKRRVPSVWNDLKQRCIRADLEWKDKIGTDEFRWCRIGSKTLLVTSWARVLHMLLDAAQSEANHKIQHDILQLQGLTDQIDKEDIFLPIRNEEVTDQSTAQRLVNYIDLIEGITERLKKSGHADTRGLSTGRSRYRMGRFMRLCDRFEIWLGVEFEVWSKFGITPIWATLEGSKKSGIAGYLQTISTMIDDARLRDDGSVVDIPIHLKTNVERDRVVEDAVQQMTRIADKLSEQSPIQ